MGRFAKAVAYAAAPKLTFTALHPTEALRLRALPLELRYGYGPRLAAIAAALVAFPLGLALGVQFGRASARERAGDRHAPRRARAGAGARGARERGGPGATVSAVPAARSDVTIPAVPVDVVVAEVVTTDVVIGDVSSSVRPAGLRSPHPGA